MQSDTFVPLPILDGYSIEKSVEDIPTRSVLVCEAKARLAEEPIYTFGVGLTVNER